MEDAILAFAMAHPWVIVLLATLQTCRLVFKPLCIAAQTYVDSTVDTADNEVLMKVQKSWPFRAFSFILDYAFSIKLPAKKVSVEVVAPTESKAA